MSEPLLNAEQLRVYADTIDIAELGAQGYKFEALARLVQVVNDDPPQALSVLTGWLIGGLMNMALMRGITVEEMAMKLRADGAR